MRSTCFGTSIAETFDLCSMCFGTKRSTMLVSCVYAEMDSFSAQRGHEWVIVLVLSTLRGVEAEAVKANPRECVIGAAHCHA